MLTMRAGSENISASCRGTEAPCTGDDLEAGVVGPHGDGLNKAVAERMDSASSASLVSSKVLRGLVSGLVNLVDGDVLEFAAVLHGAFSLCWLALREGVERRTSAVSRSVGGNGLAADVLSRVECLGEALGTQVAVPHLGEAHMLLVQLAVKGSSRCR